MSDNDLIRRGDALKALDWGDIYGRNAQDAINAIPAAQQTVKPLVWRELEKYRHGGKYSADGYTIRYVEGFFILDFAGEGKWVWRWTTIEAAKAAAQADYEYRILSALDMQPTVSPDVAALVEIGNEMAKSIRGNYYLPGIAGKWEAALARVKGEAK